jgi:hypothetical protein
MTRTAIAQDLMRPLALCNSTISISGGFDVACSRSGASRVGGRFVGRGSLLRGASSRCVHPIGDICSALHINRRSELSSGVRFRYGGQRTEERGLFTDCRKSSSNEASTKRSDCRHDTAADCAREYCVPASLGHFSIGISQLLPNRHSSSARTLNRQSRPTLNAGNSFLLTSR